MKVLDYYDKIHKVFFPDHWKDEGIESPNIIAKTNALYVCYVLLNSGIFIQRIASTKENGIYLALDSNNKSLIIEAYNDGDIGVVISDNDKKHIIYNEDVEKFDLNPIISEWKIILNEGNNEQIN
ncbi:MAG: hypothetical protein ACOC33_03760 [bacterium]